LLVSLTSQVFIELPGQFTAHLAQLFLGCRALRRSRGGQRRQFVAQLAQFLFRLLFQRQRFAQLFFEILSKAVIFRRCRQFILRFT
jgi:hypothetical protein